MTPPTLVGRPLTQLAISEAKRNWPFVVGFGVTFALILKLSASLGRECLLSLYLFKFSFQNFLVNPGYHYVEVRWNRCALWVTTNVANSTSGRGRKLGLLRFSSRWHLFLVIERLASFL